MTRRDLLIEVVKERIWVFRNDVNEDSATCNQGNVDICYTDRYLVLI